MPRRPLRSEETRTEHAGKQETRRLLSATAHAAHASVRRHVVARVAATSAVGHVVLDVHATARTAPGTRRTRPPTTAAVGRVGRSVDAASTATGLPPAASGAGSTAAGALDAHLAHGARRIARDVPRATPHDADFRSGARPATGSAVHRVRGNIDAAPITAGLPRRASRPRAALTGGPHTALPRPARRHARGGHAAPHLTHLIGSAGVAAPTAVAAIGLEVGAHRTAAGLPLRTHRSVTALALPRLAHRATRSTTTATGATVLQIRGQRDTAPITTRHAGSAFARATAPPSRVGAAGVHARLAPPPSSIEVLRPLSTSRAAGQGPARCPRHQERTYDLHTTHDYDRLQPASRSEDSVSITHGATPRRRRRCHDAPSMLARANHGPTSTPSRPSSRRHPHGQSQ